MNKYSAAKLHHSKWTAVNPVNKEKHFLVTRVLRNENEQVEKCLIEAVHSNRETIIDWQDLQDHKHWIQGWQ